jgi:hypothetical protein
LRLDQVIGRVGQPGRGPRRDMTMTEPVLFGLVANRALAPSSWKNPTSQSPAARTGAARQRPGRHGSDGEGRVPELRYGKSEDSRDDLPPIVIGMAVTRDEIPVS